MSEMNGTIGPVTRGDGTVTGTVRVNEGDGRGVTEYTATVPAVDALGQALTPAQVKALLVAAWQAQRAARPVPPADLSGQISGPVNL